MALCGIKKNFNFAHKKNHMKRMLFYLTLFLISLASFGQQKIVDEISFDVNLKEKKLIIKITDPKLTSTYDLIIYRDFEKVIMNEFNIKDNPLTIDLSNWQAGRYYFKFDYNHITQFRYFEYIPLD